MIRTQTLLPQKRGIWGFPKTRVPLLGVPLGDSILCGAEKGYPILVNTHMS